MDTTSFRRLLGRFATGVAVITTNVDGHLHGMTANALSSVSLEPPLILVCVDRRAHCHPQVLAAGRFGVSILSAGQRELSEVFARSLPPEEGVLRGARYRLDADHAVPLLEGALAALVCRLLATYPGGDHDIFVGEVLTGRAGDDGDDPLLYYGGAYRSLGSD
ncbi:MAG TPA: flavin reductase family protein [Thermoanaerobaculia bacterium]|nr:flavin reductase family protein [Thermoanaerobaculia bacterium]